MPEEALEYSMAAGDVEVAARLVERLGVVTYWQGRVATVQRWFRCALPHFAAQARIELARVHLALSDTEGARVLMREVDELLRRRPGLGTLVTEAAALRARLAEVRDPNLPGASALTAAELRLLPMLTTHLSFPEIAAEMFLSRTTIKTEAMSIYRKLGVSSRSQAVTRARKLGLLVT